MDEPVAWSGLFIVNKEKQALLAYNLSDLIFQLSSSEEMACVP